MQQYSESFDTHMGWVTFGLTETGETNARGQAIVRATCVWEGDVIFDTTEHCPPRWRTFSDLRVTDITNIWGMFLLREEDTDSDLGYNMVQKFFTEKLGEILELELEDSSPVLGKLG